MNDLPNTLGSINTAARGQRIAQLAMDTASGNIANASTPGYGRADLQVLAGGVDGFTQGARIGRAPAPLAERALFEAQRNLQFSQARLGYLTTQVGRVLGDMSAANLGHTLAQFFDAWRNLSATPDSVDARQIILGRATALTQQLTSTAQGLRDQQIQLDQGVVELLASATDRLADVATANAQILMLETAGASSVDAENRRAQSVASLVQDLGLEVLTDANGETRLLAAGISVVSGDVSLPVGTRPDPVTGFRHVVVDPSADKNLDRYVTSGQLGAMLTTRDGDLADFAATLDQFASDLVVAVNTQHLLGFGLDAAGGRNFFVPPPAPITGFARAMALSPDVAGQPTHVAAAASAVNTLPSETLNAAAIASLGDQTLASAGTETFGQALRSLATSAGLTTRQAKNEEGRRRALFESAQAVRDQQIGVSVQQQIIQMRQAEQQYEASMKVIDIQRRAIDSLLALGR